MPTPSTPTVPAKLSDLHIVDPKYDWRPGQRELVQKIVDSPKKIIMLEAECGAGKSIIGVAAAAAAQRKAIVLIQTINLQNQYMRDFGPYGAKMMAGRSHSTCNLTNKRADWAPCTLGMHCDKMRGIVDPYTSDIVEWPECNYFNSKLQAERAQTSIQNYAYWLAETTDTSRSAFAAVPWIICDEAHELDQLLMGAATITIDARDLQHMELPVPKHAAMSVIDWCIWARMHLPQISEKLGTYTNLVTNHLVYLPTDSTTFDPASVESTPDAAAVPVSFDDGFETAMGMLQIARRVQSAAESLAAIRQDQLPEWVVDIETPKTPGLTLIKPIYGKYGFQRLLAAATEKIVLMSAFLAPHLLIQTLGLDADDVEIIESPKVFDRTESKTYYCPLIRFNYRTTEQEWNWATSAMEKFMAYYAPKKGLVHTPSNKLRDTIMKYAKQSRKWIAYDGESVPQRFRHYPMKEVAIGDFLARTTSCVLLGQSISTGLDIPYVPEFQLIPKLWYMPLNDPAIKARIAADPAFYDYHTICQIVQATGRVKRAQDHHGQTIIFDAAFAFFYAKNRQNFPRWFRDSLVWDGWAAFPQIKSSIKLEARTSGVLWKVK